MFIYPTLDLLSYDIREGLGQSKDIVDENREYFKSKLPPEVAPLIDEFDGQGEYVELLGRNEPYAFEEDNYTGYYYPVRLNDSYGLLLDCSCRDNQSSDDLRWMSGLKHCIEQKSIQKPATLGKTWVFYASTLEVPVENYDLLAQKCYQTLFPKANWYEDKIGTCEFSGGQLFELWQEAGDMEHIVIILFSSEKAAENFMPGFIQDELRWFWYRHKIIWAYTQSRQLEQLLKKEAVGVDKLLESFSEQDESAEVSEILKKSNRIFRNYLELLNRLAEQLPTIETNLHNYRKRLQQMQQRWGFTFSNEFERRTTEKYVPQIQRDQTAFNLQLELIKNITVSIQAQETHHHVKHIAAIQTKVEWLEVFFASYYAAALTHYISGDFGFTKNHYGAWSIVGWAVFAILLTLIGLRPWEHSHEKKSNRFKWMLGGVTLILAVGWFLIGYGYFCEPVGNDVH